MSFYNQKGECLLEELGDNSALSRHSRNFKAILGGNHQVEVSFKANPKEKLFGLGQYQEDSLNLKGCTFANNETTWLAEDTKQIDYYICAGDTPKEILFAYTAVTGRTPMMPEYGMGFWQCKLRYWNQEQLLEVAREYYKRKIPVDVIVCDFFHWPKMGDFRFEEEFFPDPNAMVKELAEMGIAGIPWWTTDIGGFLYVWFRHIDFTNYSCRLQAKRCILTKRKEMEEYVYK